MPAILDIRGAVIRGLHTVDDRVGTEFQGEIAVMGALPGVQEGIVKGFTVSTPPKPARRGKRGVGSGVQQGRQEKRAQDFQDGVYRESRTEDLPSQKV